jgi:hypothetical protein
MPPRRVAPRGLDEKRVALVSAALRHVRDAQRLLEPEGERTPSFDQAWHLAGFGPECIRKACITERQADKALGHELGPGGEHLLEWVLALDVGAWRYDVRDWATTRPLLGRWKPDARYSKTGTCP